MTGCRLCSLRDRTDREPWNAPLLESENFLVIPSLGALTVGWVMVVPRSHAICYGALREDLVNEFRTLKLKTVSEIQKRYGSAAAFEHGPNEEKREVGCGVDHAHLHVLPIDFSLVNAACPFVPDSARWVKADDNSCREAYRAGLDYLYVEQPIGAGLIMTHRRFGSQIIRRAIASTLNIPGEYNWRDFPQLAAVLETIRNLADGTPPQATIST